MRKHIGGIGLLALLLQGCPPGTERNPAFCGDGLCIDEDLPFCDRVGNLEGNVDGTPNTCIAVACEPGEFVTCRGEETIACNAEGDNYDVLLCESGCTEGSATCTPCSPGAVRCRERFVETCNDNGAFVATETCELSCVDAPSPHCAYVAPAYIPDACDATATIDSVAFPTAQFDTDLDMGCTGGVIAQSGGPSICVVRAKSIAIPAGVTATVKGSRALALIADASVEIAGTLDVSGASDVNGPGANVGTSGRGGNVSSNLLAAGGAGFATAGARGGSSTMEGNGSSGGPASTNPALLNVLIGGSKGGGGPGTTGSAGGGGGGGGALLLIACRGRVAVSGTIEANGGGAAAAVTVTVGMIAEGSPGNGGGSGGNVVIQGLNVEVTGRLLATGGGGGSGNDTPVTFGNAGGDGDVLGGTGAAGVRNNGVGGQGGSSTNPMPGGAPIGGLPRTGGGGGGSVGFLQTYTPDGVAPALTPTTQVPALQPNLKANTR